MRRLLVLAFIWGWSFLFIKVAVEGMSPATVACGRVGLGALTLQVVLRARKIRIPVDRDSLRAYAVAALLGSCIPFTLLAWGEERVSSALTAVLNASTPLFTAVAAGVYLRDRLRGVQVAGLLVGFLGVAIAAGVGSGDVTGSSVPGATASVLAAACYGMAFAWMRRHLVAVPPMVAAAGQLTAATILLLPFAVVTSVGRGIHLQPHRALAIALLGIVGTGIAYIINYGLIADLGPTRVSLVTYIIPVVAVTVGVLVLDEHFYFRLVIGGAVIAVGVALVHDRLPSFRPPAVPASAALILVVVALGLPLVSCSSDAKAGQACGDAKREALDPNLTHVLPSGAEPAYLTDPPTSGPHQPTGDLEGVQDEPLSRPIQVGVLESGKVLIQYGDLDAGAVQAVQALASNDVVVAPNDDLPAAVVATAWITKMECDAVDATALRRFADDHIGHGPGSDG